MQRIDCPLCGKSHSDLVFQTSDLLVSAPGEFTYVRCAHCGLAYLNPQPSSDELAAHYTESYDSFQHASLQQGWARRLLVKHGFRARQRQVERLKQGGALLEIGAADGSFLHLLAASGRWAVQGIETSAVAVQTARAVYGLTLLDTPLEDAGLPRDHYDVVAMWDVLEHLPRPLAALCEVRSVLKPDGVLMLRLPLADSWDARLFGQHWAGWDAPHHLLVMGRPQLEKLLSRAGLELVSIKSVGSSWSCLAPSLRLWAATLPALPSRIIRLLVGSAILQAILAPLSWLVARIWPMSCCLVVARRSGSARQDYGGGE